MALKKTKSAAPAAKSASKAKKAEAPASKPAAKSKTSAAKPAKSTEKSKAKSTAKPPAPGKKPASAAKKTPAKAKTPAAPSKKRAPAAEPVLDPIGDVISGEGRAYLGDAELQPDEEQLEQPQTEVDAFLQETHIDASDADFEAGPGLQAARTAMEAHARQKAENKAQAATTQSDTDHAGAEIDEDLEAAPATGLRESAKPEPAKLERLQKILSAAGIASRRTAEEMIVAGRVIVNGKVVTQLGSKADPARDHIRVDGKLLHGAERHRYFMLNKPRGYVTTMSDPEGRPTVMEFLASARERVYPVGRLDYLSEGLLLMTNDGELANLLTKAGSGVEKTYLVKVAGQPTTEELERLRSGVAIEKGEPGSARVRTAPARIRPFREGDNPWFEVVLIEGRNRELRKMFGAIGHFAEKIRRVGYGPLVLDLEPGKMRELDEEEVNALRLTAEGKMKPRRAKAGQMPGDAGLPAKQRAEKRGGKTFDRPLRREFNRASQRETTERGAAPQHGAASRDNRFDRRPPKPGTRGERPRWKQEERGPKREGQSRDREFRGASQSRPEFRGPRPFGREGSRSESSTRPSFKPRGERPEFRPRPPQDRGENRFSSASRAPFKPIGDRPAFRGGPKQERGGERFGSAPQRPFKPRSDRPAFRPGPGQERGDNRFGSAPQRPFKPRSDRPPFRSGPQQERGEKPFGGAPRPPFKPRGDRPQWKPDSPAKPRLEIERVARPQSDAGFGGAKPRPSFGAKPGFGGKPSGGGRPGGFGKFRGNSRGGAKGGFSRPGAPRGGQKRG